MTPSYRFSLDLSISSAFCGKRTCLLHRAQVFRKRPITEQFCFYTPARLMFSCHINTSEIYAMQNCFKIPVSIIVRFRRVRYMFKTFVCIFTASWNSNHIILPDIKYSILNHTRPYCTNRQSFDVTE